MNRSPSPEGGPAGRPDPGWEDLAREVEAWRAAGREATLWWRDDDAVRPSPALDRLLALHPECPLGLAVVPATADPALAAVVPDRVDVLTHGFAHANQAKPGEKKSEYPPGRTARKELRTGRRRLEAIFGERALALFVPPWNRMAADAADALPAAGYRMVSGFRGQPASPLPRLDTHVDLTDWRSGRRFVGTGAALGALVEALAARRSTGDLRPTGVLSHHLVHDAGSWRFLEDLLAWGARAPGVRWVRPRDLLPDEAGRAAPRDRGRP